MYTLAQQDFGICGQIIKAPPTPVFGVCLGCQGIGWMYGLDVRKAPGGAVHGRTSAVFHDEAHRSGGGLFSGIPSGFKVVRYHSLAVVPKHGIHCFFSPCLCFSTSSTRAVIFVGRTEWRESRYCFHTDVRVHQAIRFRRSWSEQRGQLMVS